MEIKPHILLVEDEESLAIGLEFNLKAEGYAVTRVPDGRRALEEYRAHPFDLVILDIMLPYVDGFEVARQVREKDQQLPILMLTARTSAKDRVQGLQIGADDYLAKPFHLEELLLRVAGMLRRKNWYADSSSAMPEFRFGDNVINFTTMSAQTRNGRIQLTAYEAMLIRYLIDNEGKVLSRGEMLEQVWNIASDVETRTVDNFIARLRKYFEPDPESPVFIKSVRGVGYLFERVQ
jgi:two-component system alkaline phosphatase synthesis response regulator PhoP